MLALSLAISSSSSCLPIVLRTGERKRGRKGGEEEEERKGRGESSIK